MKRFVSRTHALQRSERISMETPRLGPITSGRVRYLEPAHLTVWLPSSIAMATHTDEVRPASLTRLTGARGCHHGDLEMEGRLQ